MPICKFYEQGRCKFGDRCWNEHPGDYNRSASPRGDYYAGNDPRYSWRKDQPPPLPSFSFKQAQSVMNRPPDYVMNRPPDYQDQQLFQRRPSNFNDDFADDNYQGVRFFNTHGRPPGFVKPAPSFQNQHRPHVEFSFNAAHQVSQTSVRNTSTPSFSFKAAQNQVRAAEPVSFSFKSAQTQLNTGGINSSHRNVPGVAQHQQRTYFDRPMSEEVTMTDSKSSKESVPSVLASADILKLLNLYSSLAQLSISDREQFEADKFTFGRIPIVPPPQELC